MDGIDSTHDWHGNVRHNYIGTKTEGLRHQAGTVNCGSDYFKLTL